MYPTALREYLTHKHAVERDVGVVRIDAAYKQLLPAALELSNPLFAAACLVPSYWWGTSLFDRREFVKRKRAGTLYEYKPAALNGVRSEYSRKRRELRVIFTLGTPKPPNLLQRVQWFAGAIVYVPGDDVWRKKWAEIHHEMLTRQIKCLETLKRMGEVLPDAYLKGHDKRFTQAGVAG
jgi:hypothetical protein